MLRGTIGINTFWKVIREYSGAIATRTHPRTTFGSKGVGHTLSWFFDQWLRRPGMAVLRGGWRYDAARKRVHVVLTQTQAGGPFRIPLEIAIGTATGNPRIEKIELTAATVQFQFPPTPSPRW